MPALERIFEVPPQKYAVDAAHNAEVLGEIWRNDAELKADESALIVPIDRIQAAAEQPRTYFDDVAMKRLEQTIRNEGFLHPLLVRYVGGTFNRFEIVAGERRYRAAVNVGLTELPVQIRDINRDEQWALALLENVQREPLRLREECEAVAELKTRHKMSISALVEKLGKDRGWVENRLAGAALPDDVKVLLDYPERLSHAREINKIEGPRIRARFVERAKGDISLSALKAEIAQYLPKKPEKPQPEPGQSTFVPSLPIETRQGVGFDVPSVSSRTVVSGLPTPSFLDTERRTPDEADDESVLAGLRLSLHRIERALSADRGEWRPEIEAQIDATLQQIRQALDVTLKVV
jgi:ParB family chromosome partitioning protein